MSWKSTIFILAVLLGSGADGLAQETTAIVPGVAVEHFKGEPERQVSHRGVRRGFGRARRGLQPGRAAHAASGQRSGFTRPAVDRRIWTQTLLLLHAQRYKRHPGRAGSWFTRRRGSRTTWLSSARPLRRVDGRGRPQDSTAATWGAPSKHWRNTRASSDIGNEASSRAGVRAVRSRNHENPFAVGSSLHRLPVDQDRDDL